MSRRNGERGWGRVSTAHNNPGTAERCREVMPRTTRAVVDVPVVRRYAADDTLTVTVTPQDDDGTVVVTVTGEVDHLSAAVFSVALSGCLETGCRRLVLDLTAVTFLNAAGLAVITDLHRRAHAQAMALTVCSDSALITRCLALVARRIGRDIGQAG